VDDLLRFLDLVRRELGCQDAHFEYGGEPPREREGVRRNVWADLQAGWRVVAIYDAPPQPEADGEVGVEVGVRRAEKLQRLIEAFTGVGPELQLRIPRVTRPSASQELDEALALLAEGADALRAVVIDEDSPVLWGSSELPLGTEDVEAAMWIAELADSATAIGIDLAGLVELVQLNEPELRARLEGVEPRKLRERLLRKLPVVKQLGSHRDAQGWAAHFLTCRAIAAVRRAPERHEAVEDDLGWFARDFGGIYHVILVYDGQFSEIGATRMMQRALPVIERLVLSLPPVDPTPKSARVLQFKR